MIELALGVKLEPLDDEVEMLTHRSLIEKSY